jgi:hypothetical protein
MITGKFSEISDYAVRRYESLLMAFRSVYKAAISSSDFSTVKSFARVKKEAYVLARNFLDTERDFIKSETDKIALEAHTSVYLDLSVNLSKDLTESTVDHLIDLEDYLITELTIQIERDIATLVKSLRQVAYQIQISSFAKNTTFKKSLMEFRMGDVKELEFSFYDRAAAKWSSKKYVRSLWRQHLLSAYNETYMMDLADHGVSVVQIEHTNSSSRFHGMKISLISGSAYPMYEEIKSEIFHPNSDAIVKVIK